MTDRAMRAHAETLRASAAAISVYVELYAMPTDLVQALSDVITTTRAAVDVLKDPEVARTLDEAARLLPVA